MTGSKSADNSADNWIWSNVVSPNRS